MIRLFATRYSVIMSPRITRSSSRKSFGGLPETQKPEFSDDLKSATQTKAALPQKKAQRRKKAGQTSRDAQFGPSMEPPATPPAKRLKRDPTILRPPTETVALHSAGQDIPSLTADERPAEPHMTNAPLVTPRGSKLVTYTKGNADVSPSKSGIPRATTTTGHLLQDACNHLIKIDARMGPLIERHACRIFSPESLTEPLDPFQKLCDSIMSQQVSGAAAASIKKKFVGLFTSEPLGPEEAKWAYPTPAAVAAKDVPFLRQAGLSQRKAEYIQGLAGKFANGELSAKMLIDAPYEELVEKLVAVRGIGLWSVEMFACFALKRMDVFSTGDLGVQ